MCLMNKKHNCKWQEFKDENERCWVVKWKLNCLKVKARIEMWWKIKGRNQLKKDKHNFLEVSVLFKLFELEKYGEKLKENCHWTRT